MRVVSYIRVSSKGQVEGDGPDRQRDAIQQFNKTNGLIWCGEYFEQGVSGTVEGIDRPEFSTMLTTMMSPGNEVKAFVVERMDRLARDLMVQELLLAECRKLNIKVFSADQGLQDMASDGGDPTRVLIRQVLGALAQWEKSALVKKLRVARERKKAETGHCEGNKFFGHNPGEAELINFLRHVLEGAEPTSYGNVARMLNDGGFKNRKGGQFTRQGVRALWLNIQQKDKQ